MKLFLLTFVVCFAVTLAAPADKQKRDILPGDPRYGTDYHHENENEVQIGKAAGGYVGSYSVHDESQSEEAQPQPHSTYGLPNAHVAQTLASDFITTNDNAKSIGQVPSTSYGIPETQTTIYEQSNYDVLQKSTIPEHHHVQQPAVVTKHVGTVSVPQVKVATSKTQGALQYSVPSLTSSVKSLPATFTSYSSIPVKTVDTHVHVKIPQPYAVPVTKHVPYPIPVPHRVDVPKPYYVRVPQPVQVPVNRPYAVEVPRPVAYPVPQYVQTTVPVVHPHVAVDAIRASNYPFQGFIENAQVQNVLANLPSFQNPFEGLQNSFENFELPSFPSLPSFAGLPSLPSVPSAPSLPTPQQPQHIADASSGDTVAVDNLTVRGEKTKFKPVTACAGCSIGAVGSASSASSGVAVTTKHQNQAHEHVQAIDANGGYIY